MHSTTESQEHFAPEDGEAGTADGYQHLRGSVLRIETLAAQVQLLAMQASVDAAGARSNPSALAELPRRLMDMLAQISDASARQADVISSLDGYFGRGPEDAGRIGGRWRRSAA